MRLIEENAVRHDLPRALLVLLAARRRGACSRRTACASSTSRSCRPTAARCGSTRCHADDAAHAVSDARAGACGARGAAAGLDRHRHLRAFAEPCSRTKRELLEFADRAARTTGKAIVGLRRPGQGQHAAQLLRRRHRLHRVHGRPQPAQAGRFLPGSHIPIRAPEEIARHAARLRAASCRGTCATRSWSSSRFVRDWGGRVRRARPPRSSCYA